MCGIAETFSTRYGADHMLEVIRKIKPAAADYIENVNDTYWRSTSWLVHHGCKQKTKFLLGMGECTNNMLADAHNVGWLKAVERIVDIIST
jgi:hypothetical protein